MKTKQIIDTLQEYNDWRRARGKWDVDAFNAGESLFDTISAHEIGLALDAAIGQLGELSGARWLIKHYERVYDKSEKGTVTEGIGNCVKQLKKERDEARHIASYWRNMAGNFAISKRDHEFPWEKGSK